MNQGLWAHPQTKSSLARLESWGCKVVPPTINGRRVTMAPIAEVVQAAVQASEK